MMWYTQEQLDQWLVLQEKAEASDVSLSFNGDDLFKSIRLEGDFTLTSGKKSNYFYDFERMTPNYMTFVSGLLHEKLKNKCDFEFTIGPAYGGIVPAHTIADFANRKFVSYNPKSNEFRGQLTQVSGRYIIVDDVISTYGTVRKTIEAATDKFPNSRCVGVACFVFRGPDIHSEFPTYFLQRGEVEV